MKIGPKQYATILIMKQNGDSEPNVRARIEKLHQFSNGFVL